MHPRSQIASLILLLLLTAGPTGAAEWQATTVEFLKEAKPGYGGLAGVAVDPATGDVYVNVSDRGVYRSTNQGRTWQRHGDSFKGRTEQAGALMIDPVGKGKRLAAATVYGAPIALGSTEGGNWKFLHPRSSHVDWCALDWSDPESKFILAMKHESGGLLIVSRDGGKTFQDVGKGYGPAWVFDGDVGVVAEMKTKERPAPGLVRTTDGGKTFTPCGRYHAVALPKWRKGVLYWLADDALIASADKGATWKKIVALKGGRYGPIFGKDDKHLFVLTSDGVVESRDAGGSWTKPLALEKEVKGGGLLTWLDYDPIHDVLYVMKMRSQLYKLARRP